MQKKKKNLKMVEEPLLPGCWGVWSEQSFWDQLGEIYQNLKHTEAGPAIPETPVQEEG